MNWPLKDCWYRQSVDTKKGFSSEVISASVKTKVVVIGAGFAGLATAIGLLERGCRDVVVLESESVGYGASGRNGGFIMAGYSLPEAKLIKRLGRTTARNLYQLSMFAQAKIKQRIAHYQIDCDLVEGGIVLADWFKHESSLHAQQRLMNESMGTNWAYLSPLQLSNYVVSQRYGGGLLEPDGAHFHPLKYLHGLAEQLSVAGVKVFEQARAESIEQQHCGWRIGVEGGHFIEADQVVVCAGGYIKGLPHPAAKAVLPIATYAMVTEPLGSELTDYIPAQAAIYDTRFAFDYYRKVMGDRLLWGGRIAVSQPSAEQIKQRLKHDIQRVFPTLSDIPIASAWGGLMGYTRPQMPSIKESQPGLWHALGFGGHGVCSTTVAGEIVATAITGGQHQQHLFEPFGLPNAYGWLGLLGAQGYYWWRQMRDTLKI